MSEDAVVVASKYYKSILENERVRLLEYKAEPGAKTAMHSHPDVLAYAVTPIKAKFTLPDGQSMEAELKVGDTMFVPASSHATENIGTGDAHVRSRPVRWCKSTSSC